MFLEHRCPQFNPSINDIQLYSLAGGIFLLNWGQYLFFVFPEWLAKEPCNALRRPWNLLVIYRQIYGGIGIGVAVAAALSILALSNVSSSPIFSRPRMFSG